MTDCLICGQSTDLHIAAECGGEAGHLCQSCAYWCDGNIVEAA